MRENIATTWLLHHDNVPSHEFLGFRDLLANYNVSDVLCACAAWSFTLMEERGIRVFENRILTRGMRMGSGEYSTMRNFILSTVHQYSQGD